MFVSVSCQDLFSQRILCEDGDPAPECGLGSLNVSSCECSVTQEDGCIARYGRSGLTITGKNCKENCEDFSDLGFKCVKSYLCSDNHEIHTDGTNGETPLFEPFLFDVTDVSCSNQFKKCCRDVRPPATLPALKVPTVDYSQCGRVSAQNFRFINFGNDDESLKKGTAELGEFPYMCAIFRKENGKTNYVGGASLISKDKVLTVAHKFLIKLSKEELDLTSNKNFIARCGENMIDEEPDLEHQDREVEDIMIHPDYEPNLLKFNIAILIVREQFDYKSHIGPVCLPPPNVDYEGESECISTGWGSSATDSFENSKLLKKVTLPVVNRKECIKHINQLPRFEKKEFILYKDWLCVGGESNGFGTCRGDGGSPHVCKINQKWIQVGAVAFGFQCEEEIPSIYSSVSHNMCWIDWVMSCHQKQTSEFSVLEVSSYNDLAAEDCQTWLDLHSDLKDQCNVGYRQN